jgi:hypothetical protein
VRGLNLQAGHITSNNQGIVFSGLPGRPIHDVSVSHVAIMQARARLRWGLD